MKQKWLASGLALVILFCAGCGGSVKETAEHMVEGGCTWVGSACIVDRSGGTQQLGPDLVSLFKVSFATYDPDDCPLCREGVKLDALVNAYGISSF